MVNPENPPAARTDYAEAPSAVAILGPDPRTCGDDGLQKTRIGTLFPAHRTLITLPGIHATQRLDFVEHQNGLRRARGEAPLSTQEEELLMHEAVDLLFGARQIYIRPDPSRMDLAFAADELLDEMQLVSRRDIRFLFVMDPRVHEAIQARGENWRISALPQSAAGMCRMIEGARVAIREGAIYYYNPFTGTRHLTYQEFSRLGLLGDSALARQLREIAVFSAQRSRRGTPEVAFFPEEARALGPDDFQGVDFPALSSGELRARFEALRTRFRDAVAADLRADDPQVEVWRNRMLSALVSQQDQTLTVDLLRELSPEFFMQVEWLPGGRFEQGEFIFDSIFDESARLPADPALHGLCDPFVREFIFSYIREYGTLDFINIGRIGMSLSNVRPLVSGRRGVYLAQLKLPNVPAPVLRLIRLQKWGIAEHLDAGKSLLQAVLENDDYTDYVLDRLLGARQLGMNLPPRSRVMRTRETYAGSNPEVRGRTIPVICFERGYLGGIATDKVPPSKYLDPAYSSRLAMLLGRAAASNIIVGRAMERASQTIFDDGDEIILEDATSGLPEEITVGDPTGAFADYRRDLLEIAPDYARPVNRRSGRVPELGRFAETYLASFKERFSQLQGDYRRRRRAFDSLFKHCRYDKAGSFAYRWECVLARLDRADADALALAIRRHVDVLRLSPAPTQPVGP